MGNKIYSSVVLLLWGATTTWLVTAKVLPPFFAGEPPIASLATRDKPTGWRITLNSRPCGSAVAQAVAGASGANEVHSRLVIDAIPLPEVAPKWMRGVLSQLGEVSLDMRTRTTLDTLGSLAAFETKIRVNDSPSLIGMSGVVLNNNLRLRFRAGGYTKVTEYPWHDDQLLAGALMPNTRLTNLRVGKTWRTKVYTPFGPPNAPLSMIEAEVVALEDLAHNGEVMPIYRVVYRVASAAWVSAAERVRREVWVDQAGRVLRQKVTFLNAQLCFERLPVEESEQLAGDVLELDRYATTTTPDRPRDSGGGAGGP